VGLLGGSKVVQSCIRGRRQKRRDDVERIGEMG
jgi:hypothetical protein